MTIPPDCGGPYTLDPILLRKLCEGQAADALAVAEGVSGRNAAWNREALVPLLRTLRDDVDAGEDTAAIVARLIAQIEIALAIMAASFSGDLPVKAAALVQMSLSIQAAAGARMPVLLGAYASEPERAH